MYFLLLSNTQFNSNQSVFIRVCKNLIFFLLYAFSLNVAKMLNKRIGSHNFQSLKAKHLIQRTLFGTKSVWYKVALVKIVYLKCNNSKYSLICFERGSFKTTQEKVENIYGM